MELNGISPGNSFNALKNTIAEKLERAADSLGRESESGEVPGSYCLSASEWLRHSAEYVRELDLKKADLELRYRIRAHPAQSIVIALTAGVLTGLWLRRR